MCDRFRKVNYENFKNKTLGFFYHFNFKLHVTITLIISPFDYVHKLFTKNGGFDFL